MTSQTILQPEIPPQQREVAGLRLPGMRPVGQPDWVTVDSAYSAQLAEKARLLRERPGDVLAVDASAQAGLAEMLNETLALLAQRPDFEVGKDVTRPDGLRVEIDRSAPLLTLSQLCAEDLILLEKRGDEHVMTAGLLCFPASWSLDEKFMKPLTGIHAPVDDYDDNIAQRVQRLFDGIKPGMPLWRANLLPYRDPALFQPRRENDRRNKDHAIGFYERSERQTLWRLPKTGGVVFAIQTVVAPV